MSLIRLTRASRSSSTQPDFLEITVNVSRVMYIENYDGTDEGESRVWMESGRQIIVMETQDEIREASLESSLGNK